MVKLAVRVFSLLAVPAVVADSSADGVAAPDTELPVDAEGEPLGYCGMGAGLLHLRQVRDEAKKGRDEAKKGEDKEAKQKADSEAASAKKDYDDQRAQCITAVRASKELAGKVTGFRLWRSEKKDYQFCSKKLVTKTACETDELANKCCVWYPKGPGFKEGRVWNTQDRSEYEDYVKQQQEGRETSKTESTIPEDGDSEPPVQPASVPPPALAEEEAKKAEAARQATEAKAKQAKEAEESRKAKEAQKQKQRQTKVTQAGGGRSPAVLLGFAFAGACCIGLIVAVACYMCRGDAEEDPDQESADESEATD